MLSSSNTAADADLLECQRHDWSIQPIDMLKHPRFGRSWAGRSHFTLYRSIGYTCRLKANGSLADP
jgi:hypothetical protein